MTRPTICPSRLPLRWVGCVVLLCLAAAPALQPAFAADPPAKPAAKSGDAPEYTVKNGNQVDENTYKGYLYYGDQCHRCHGPDALGSSYAPALVDSLKHMTKEQVENTIINGRKDVNTASQKVMPAFGGNEDVVTNMDAIYGYLKARSDGALGRGHPEHMKSSS